MDLDDDELRATRKLLGVDKYISDKEDLTDYLINREDSIEYKTNDKIENLKSLLYTGNLTQYGKRQLIEYYENEINSQKQINEEHQQINRTIKRKSKRIREI